MAFTLPAPGPTNYARGHMQPRVRNRMALAFVEYSLETEDQVLRLRTWVCGESIRKEVRAFRRRHLDAKSIEVIIATGEKPKPPDRPPIGERVLRLSHPILKGER